MDPTLTAAMYRSISQPMLPLLTEELLLLVLLPAATVLGHRAGRIRLGQTARRGRLIDVSVGDTTLGAILALLGLILAFTFSNALGIFQTQKAALLDEASAIAGAFQHADFAPDPERSTLQQDLLAYAETRVIPESGVGYSKQELKDFLTVSLTAQAALWPDTLAAMNATLPDGTPAVAEPLQALLASTVTSIFDAHLARMQSFATPVSLISQMMTLALVLLALFLLAYRDGATDHPLTWRTFVFALMLWVVISTIMDTQRGQSGFVQEDDSVLTATIVEMRMAMGMPATPDPGQKAGTEAGTD